MRILIFAVLAVVALAQKLQTEADEQELREAMAISAEYTLEIHYVTTYDGYILSMCRIYKGVSPAENPIVALVMPGIKSSSVDWAILKEKSLAYMLADEDFDVWIVNPRGNLFSRFHQTLSPDTSHDYWKFSWQEMGVTDTPAQVDYILEKTKQPNLHCIGQGQGVTVILVMLSVRPEYNDKIKSVQAMSPLVFMTNMRSALKYFAYPFAYKKSLEFLAHNSTEVAFVRAFCQRGGGEYCLQVFFYFAGADPEQIDPAWLYNILKFYPAGGSSRQHSHFAQLIISQKFQYYQEHYGQTVKEFDLSKVTAAFCIYAGINDPISTVEDSKTLFSKLSNKKCPEVVVIRHRFNHMDFPWGKKANKYLYRQLMDNLFILDV